IIQHVCSFPHDVSLPSLEGDLYSAAPLDTDGGSLQFRRKAGNRTNVWMYDKPTFISVSWVKRREDPDNEKIYIFFREKNSDQNPEADPWISRVARVCKVDEGGSKRFFQNMWTSFLKARLVCGFPEESLYFNRLQDIYVMHAEDWKDTRVYALFTLFTSSWNSTAVCIYSIGMIEELFENSTFKGYNKDVPKPRPGTVTCVPFNHQINEACIHKGILNGIPCAARCWQLCLCQPIGEIIFLTIIYLYAIIICVSPCAQKKLVVGFPEKVSIMDLQRCHEYNKSCADCVLARDPYCAWATLGSSPSPEDLWTVHSVPPTVPFYLSCPIDSYHAVYTWEHEDQSSPCLQMQSNCLHLIPAMAHENYGGYECVSKEKDYRKVVKSYHLTEQIIQDTNENTERMNYASAAMPQKAWITLGLAVLGIFS
uniref:Semaphorin 7A (JohnMiltonHagen blood group) n=1 Tax=Cyclopterus lumpus TaxID=8103 RepID=A0A8C2WBG8_CYCLU